MLPVRIVRRHRQLDVTRQVEPARRSERLMSVIRRISTSSSGATMISVSHLDVVVDPAEYGPVQRKIGAETLDFPPRRADTCCTRCGPNPRHGYSRTFPTGPCSVRPPAGDLKAAASDCIPPRRWSPSARTDRWQRAGSWASRYAGVSNWLTERASSPTAADGRTRACAEPGRTAEDAECVHAAEAPRRARAGPVEMPPGWDPRGGN